MAAVINAGLKRNEKCHGRMVVMDDHYNIKVKIFWLSAVFCWRNLSPSCIRFQVLEITLPRKISTPGSDNSTINPQRADEACRRLNTDIRRFL